MTEMTKAALAGFSGEPCGWLWSSPMWMACEAGKALAAAGKSAPKVCTMSRGYAVNVVTGNGAFKVKFLGDKLDKCALTAM